MLIFVFHLSFVEEGKFENWEAKLSKSDKITHRHVFIRKIIPPVGRNFHPPFSHLKAHCLKENIFFFFFRKRGYWQILSKYASYHLQNNVSDVFLKIRQRRRFLCLNSPLTPTPLTKNNNSPPPKKYIETSSPGKLRFARKCIPGEWLYNVTKGIGCVYNMSKRSIGCWKVCGNDCMRQSVQSGHMVADGGVKPLSAIICLMK